MQTTAILEDIRSKKAVIGIVGLGYVGLPLMLQFARKGFKVLGVDIDGKKVEQLGAGKSYIRHIPSSAIQEQQARISASTDFAKLKDCAAVIMCVPTPLNKNREPDMSFVEGTARSVAPHLQKGQLVVLESTTYPGTTDELVADVLKAGSKGLVAGKDYFLSFSPEREDPGNAKFDTQRIPKLVGGLTPACREVATSLYAAVLDKVVPVSSTRVAEMAKLLENIFRNVNIALVNELKIVCERMGMDVWEVIDAAATKPFGFMPFYPGPGLGGHCIPIDPFYLTWKAREYELSTRFIELAGEVNNSMPHYVIERTATALNEAKKPLKGSRVLVLGLAYKKDIDDVRESPALRIIELFQERGSEVEYHDPYCPETHKMRHHDLGMRSVELTDDKLKSADVVVIVTDHSSIDYQRVLKLAPLIVDTRNATKGGGEYKSKVFRA